MRIVPQTSATGPPPWHPLTPEAIASPGTAPTARPEPAPFSAPQAFPLLGASSRAAGGSCTVETPTVLSWARISSESAGGEMWPLTAQPHGPPHTVPSSTAIAATRLPAPVIARLLGRHLSCSCLHGAPSVTIASRPSGTRARAVCYSPTYAPMVALKLMLLGTFEARLPSGAAVKFGRRKDEALLAYLALHSGQMQPRGKLGALLWGNSTEKEARHSLRQALVTLRDAGCLVEEGGAVGVSPDAIEVDVAVFERLAADGSAGALDRASALYRGDLLEGISVTEPPFEEWLRYERERLREMAGDVLAKRIDHLRRTGAIDQAVQVAVRLLALDRTEESVYRTLMRLHARQGRRGAALRLYQVCVEVLERELGTEPEPETKQLYRELLQTRPRPARAEEPPGRPAPVTTSGPALVGRADELLTLRQRLDDVRRGRGAIGLIQGEAGIGKTRLVEALVAEAIEAGSQVVLGRAYESERVLPLGPWVDAFRAGRVIPGAIEDLEGPSRAELARLFPELGTAAPDTLAAVDYLRLFAAMARTVEHLASSCPLVVVLEDLHWADGTTLALLAYLGRRLAAWPVLVIGSLRVEEMVDAPVLRGTLADLGLLPRFFSATLGPLSEPETVALVRSLMKAGTEDATV